MDGLLELILGSLATNPEVCHQIACALVEQRVKIFVSSIRAKLKS